jgi:CBS domain-containing protein
MLVREIMTQPVIACRATDSLDVAARLMWDHDCGILPVVGDDGVVVGLVTDRDICMAAYTQGKPLRAIEVMTAMAAQVWSCAPSDPLSDAERTMREKKVRRLPVTDRRGRAVGMLSLNDIVRHAVAGPEQDGQEHALTTTLASICEPRGLALSPTASRARATESRQRPAQART